MANIKWSSGDGERASCEYEDCDRDVRCLGLCSKHYYHLYYCANNGLGRKRQNRKADR